MRLGDYYREHGETKHVRPIERALDTRMWRDTTSVASLAGKSRNYTNQVLIYLMEECRAERQHEQLERPVFGHQTWKWVWRRRSTKGLPGEPTLD